MPSTLRSTPLAALLTCCIVGSAARADDTKSTKVYIDVATQKPNAPIRGGADREVEVFTILPKGSTVRFRYWALAASNDKESCELSSPPPPEPIERSGLPSTDEGSDQQRYVAHLGPFRYDVRYCVRVSGEFPVVLDGAAKLLVAKILEKTLIEAARWAVGEKRTFQTPCHAPDGAISHCELTKQFEREAQTLMFPEKLQVAGDPKSRTPGEAFEHALKSQLSFKLTLEKELAKLVNGRTALTKLRPLKQAIDVARETLVYTASDGTTTNLAPDAQKLLSELGDLDINDPATWSRAEDDANAVRELVGKYGKLDSLDLDANKDVRKYVENVKKLGKVLDLLAASSVLFVADAQGEYSSVLEGFVATLQSLQQVEVLEDFTWEPTYSQRFPMYVSADLGVAAALLVFRPEDRQGNASASQVRGEVVPYFGLNFYFIAIDKDEPLRWFVRSPDETAGRNFLRRFAVTTGISLLRPSLNRDIGVVGLVGKQVLLLGAGFRLSDYVRLSGGAMLFRQESPNPLSDKPSIKAAPYLSLSVDVDVLGTVREWFDKARNTIK